MADYTRKQMSRHIGPLATAVNPDHVQVYNGPGWRPPMAAVDRDEVMGIVQAQGAANTDSTFEWQAAQGTKHAHTIEPGRAWNYAGNASVHGHEALHLLLAEKGEGETPDSPYYSEVTKASDGVLGSGVETGHHGFMEAQYLYSSPTQQDYDRRLKAIGRYLNTDEVEEMAELSDIPALEFGLGARLPADITTKQGLASIVKKARQEGGSEALQRDAYVRAREQQSYIGRGYLDPWQRQPTFGASSGVAMIAANE